jgi:murein DD-endopeptidase MepM/ murein hydrolase activator NlpD
MKCKNIYRFPLEKKYSMKSKRRKILWHIENIIVGLHSGSLIHAIDFMIPVGTPIYAALDGKVVWIKSDSNDGGPSKKYWLSGNRIVIKHKNNEYTGYEHFKHNGIIVKVGQKVKKGQLIGYSGKTGYGFLPHLHFEVFNKPSKDKSEGNTLEVYFDGIRETKDGDL